MSRNHDVAGQPRHPCRQNRKQRRTAQVALGLQLFAIGLLGELIIFTHAREMKDYKIDRVIEFADGSESGEGAESDDALKRG